MIVSLNVPNDWVDREFDGCAEDLRAWVMRVLEERCAHYEDIEYCEGGDTGTSEEEREERERAQSFGAAELLSFLQHQPWAVPIETLESHFRWTGKNVRAMLAVLHESGRVTVKNGMVNA
jgi:hypothetical protein